MTINDQDNNGELNSQNQKHQSILSNNFKNSFKKIRKNNKNPNDH